MVDDPVKDSDIPLPKPAATLYASKKKREENPPKRESEYMGFIRENMR